MRVALALLALLIGPGCAGMAPFDPPVAGEMDPGPGLISGPSGEFVLFRRGGASDELPDGTAEPAIRERDLTRPPPE